MREHVQTVVRSALARFGERLKDPARQWKISETDYTERDLWEDYIAAFEDAVRAHTEVTGTTSILAVLRQLQRAEHGSDLGDFGNVLSETLSLGGLTWVRTWTPTLILESRIGLFLLSFGQ